jgi:hypothetical protein
MKWWKGLDPLTQSLFVACFYGFCILFLLST